MLISFVARLSHDSDAPLPPVVSVHVLECLLISLRHSRQADLDRAMQYYELLYDRPEEILQGIVAHGPAFTEAEYKYVSLIPIIAEQHLLIPLLNSTCDPCLQGGAGAGLAQHAHGRHRGARAQPAGPEAAVQPGLGLLPLGTRYYNYCIVYSGSFAPLPCVCTFCWLFINLF